MNFEPQTIVIFNHRHMGDALGSFPAILAMRERWPGARIVCVAAALPLNLFEGAGLADRLILQERTLRGTLRNMAQVRREKPDVAVCFSSTFRVALVAKSSGARVRAGFTSTKHRFAINLEVPWNGLQSTQLDLEMARALGAPTTQTDYVGLLQISDDERAVAARWLGQHNAGANKPLVGLNLGASVERRRWSVPNFAAVANALSAEAQIVVFGGPGDLAMIEELKTLVGAPLIVAAGEFTPRQSAALIERCATFISGDTGPMHLAMAVNTPTVALFGLVPSALRMVPNRGHIALEHNASCQQLPHAKCAFEQICSCLAAIAPAEVVAAARTQLAKPEIV